MSPYADVQKCVPRDPGVFALASKGGIVEFFVDAALRLWNAMI